MHEQDHSEREPTPQQLPTTLSLFDLPSAELATITQERERFDEVENIFVQAYVALDKFAYKLTQRIDKLRSFQIQRVENLKSLDSQISLSRYFLSLYEDLSARGATVEDVFSFFWQQSAVIIETEDTFERTSTGFRVQGINVSKERYYKSLEARQLMILTDEDVPQWFHGDKKSYVSYCTASLDYEKFLDDRSKDEDEHVYHFPGIVRFGTLAVPDWLTTATKDHKPSVEEIRAELDEDKMERMQLDEQIYRAGEQIDILHSSYQEKKKRNTHVQYAYSKEIAQTRGGFAEILMLINQTQNTKKRSMDTHRFKSLNLSEEDLDAELRNQAAREFSEFISMPGNQLRREFTALWIENNLQGLGLIDDAKQPLTDEARSAFRFALQVKEDSGVAREWGTFPSKDKKVLKYFRYNMTPLLGLLNEDEKGYLTELIDSMGNTLSAETLILDTSSAVRSGYERLFGRKVEVDLRFPVIVTDINKFASKWVGEHWRWAYAQMVHATNKSLVPPEAPGQKTGTYSTPEIEQLSNEIEHEVEGIKRETENLSVGPLSGWDVRYGINFDEPHEEKYWREIAGGSEDERVVAIAKFLFEEKIPSTIKPEEVVAELEDIVQRRDTVEEHIRPRRGEWKRARIGKMRLFYITDEEKKQILFHLYKKEAMSYRKL